MYRPAFSLDGYELAIRSAIAILDPTGQELNDTDAWAIVWSAIATIIKHGAGGVPLSPSEVLDEADKAAAIYFRKTPANFVMVTSLFIAEFPAKGIRIGNCESRR